MKRLALAYLACLFASLTACGGGSKSGTSTMPANETATASAAAPDCKAAADKIAAGDGELSTALEARCQSDSWNDETRACVAEKGDDACTLSPPQKEGIAQARAEIAAKQEQAKAEAQKSEAPAEQAAKQNAEEGQMGKKDAPKTRGAVKKPKGDSKTADPDEGGE